MIDEDPAAFAAHKLRISDYLLDGAWHSVHNDAGAWMFTDGHSEHPVPQSLMQPMHLRFVELILFLSRSLREGDASAN